MKMQRKNARLGLKKALVCLKNNGIIKGSKLWEHFNWYNITREYTDCHKNKIKSEFQEKFFFSGTSIQHYILVTNFEF